MSAAVLKLRKTGSSRTEFHLQTNEVTKGMGKNKYVADCMDSVLFKVPNIAHPAEFNVPLGVFAAHDDVARVFYIKVPCTTTTRSLIMARYGDLCVEMGGAAEAAHCFVREWCTGRFVATLPTPPPPPPLPPKAVAVTVPKAKTTAAAPIVPIVVPYNKGDVLFEQHAMTFPGVVCINGIMSLPTKTREQYDECQDAVRALQTRAWCETVTEFMQRIGTDLEHDPEFGGSVMLDTHYVVTAAEYARVESELRRRCASGTWVAISDAMHLGMTVVGRAPPDVIGLWNECVTNSNASKVARDALDRWDFIMAWAMREEMASRLNILTPKQTGPVVQLLADAGHIPDFGAVMPESLEVEISDMQQRTMVKINALLATADDDDDDDSFVPMLIDFDNMDGAIAEPLSPVKPKAAAAAPPKEGGVLKRNGPQTHAELKALAMQTKDNTDKALDELKNELRRMAGKVVSGDHVPIGGSAVAAADTYSLDPMIIMQQLRSQGVGASSSSSSSSSSSDEEPMLKKSKTVVDLLADDDDDDEAGSFYDELKAHRAMQREEGEIYT